MTEVKQDQGAAKAKQQLATSPVTAAPARTGTTLRDLVAQQQGEIARALPKGLDANRFVRVVQTELRKNPALLKCSSPTFLGAVLTAAQLGLEFGPVGQAYLVPFKNHGTDEVQLIIGYKGWLNLIHRGGQIASIAARAVHENDTFRYSYGATEDLLHVPAAGERGPVVAYYCVVKTKNGGLVFEVMSKDEVTAHMNRYAKKREGKVLGPWATHFDEMALKTVFKKVYTWLPMSTDLTMAASVDEGMVFRQSIDDEPEVAYSEVDESESESEVVDAEVVA